ncbi:MAG: ABC transporter permease subunit [Candidatus Sericytochromatia bacterium]|nr:ABC transporter permease subunit [Candidatus Sericytochromatia bacterium]
MYNKKYNVSFCIYIFFIAFFISLPAFASETDDTWQKIKAEKFLTWGSDAEGGAPYCYYDPNKPTELIGFEVDMMKIISKRLGIKDKMIQNDWDTLIPALKRKSFDIVFSGIEITPSRKQEINFTRPYYVYSQQIVVGVENTTIHEQKDLKGHTVGTLSASAAMKILSDMGLVPGKDLMLYPTVVGAYSDLAIKRTEAVLLELPIANFYAKPNKLLKFVGKPFNKGYYGIGVRKEDKVLLSKMNQVISDMLESGELEKIYKKWNLWTDKQSELSNFKEDAVEEITKKTFLQRVPVELPILLKGALLTVELCFLSMIIAVILGLSVAIIRMYGPKPLKFIFGTYVEVFRGTPLLIQLYIIYYGLPEIGIKFNSFSAAIIGLSLNYAAYESENYRAGIKSIPKGQMEAALALGMTKPMALRKIIIPQAIKVVIPPVTNDFISMFKDSSIVSTIGMVELTKNYNYMASVTYDYIGLGLMTAGIYFLMSYPASLFAKSIERRMSNER